MSETSGGPPVIGGPAAAVGSAGPAHGALSPAVLGRLATARRVLAPGVLELAYHAAVPVAVDPRLVHLLRINFFADPPMALPYEAEAELLLSPLFDDIGDGLYEMDERLRELLLLGLTTRFGLKRVHLVAVLLEQYVENLPFGKYPTELEYAQRLTALGILNPTRAAEWLAEATILKAPTMSLGQAWLIAMRSRQQRRPDPARTFDDEVAAIEGTAGARPPRQRRDALRLLTELSGLPGADPAAITAAITRLTSAVETGQPPQAAPGDPDDTRDAEPNSVVVSGESVDEESPAGLERVLFFLSYARSDDDPIVHRFFNDLCCEVRVMAGLPSTAEVGFMDVDSIELGAAWTARLSEALAECSTFIALCSPRYFVSDACGREWSVFADRMRRHQAVTGDAPSCLIPVQWVPQRASWRGIPEVVSRLRYDDGGFGEVYGRDGLRQLLRLQRNRDDYLVTLTLLAERIVANAVTRPLRPLTVRDRADLSTVQNAFATVREQIPQAVTPSSPDPSADHVRFVVAAPNRAEASAVRDDVRFYGDDATDWAPYLPELRQPLARFAARVAARRGLTSEITALPLGGSDTAPVPRGGIVVLLVDPWALKIERYRLALAEYERQPVIAVAVLVPRNVSDPETSGRWRYLADGLREVFRARAATAEASAYRTEIVSPQAFDDDLQIVIEVARNRLFSLDRSLLRDSEEGAGSGAHQRHPEQPPPWSL